MPDLVPVDHDPFVSLTPVAHDPFSPSVPISRADVNSNSAPINPGHYAEEARKGPDALQSTGDTLYNIATIPQRAFESSERFRQTGEYDPGPILEAATLPMGTGAVAGVPMRAGEVALGAGPIRGRPPIKLPVTEVERDARDKAMLEQWAKDIEKDTELQLRLRNADKVKAEADQRYEQGKKISAQLGDLFRKTELNEFDKARMKKLAQEQERLYPNVELERIIEQFEGEENLPVNYKQPKKNTKLSGAVISLKDWLTSRKNEIVLNPVDHDPFTGSK